MEFSGKYTGILDAADRPVEKENVYAFCSFTKAFKNVTLKLDRERDRVRWRKE